jgi:hypothetical protein
VVFAKTTRIRPAEGVIVNLIRIGALVVEVVLNEFFAIKFRVWVFRQLLVPFVEVEPENSHNSLGVK